MNPPPSAESQRPARSHRTWLAELALFLLVWLSFMQPARLLAPSLDASWQMMLGFAHDHGLKYGTDIVPTMGPAGFLTSSSPAIHHLWARFAWMLLGNAFLALVFCRVGHSLHGFRRLLYFFTVVLLLAPFAESMQGLAIVILAIRLTRLDVRAAAVGSALISCAIGILALFKFTHFTLGAAVVACAVAHACYLGEFRRSAGIVAGFVIGFVGGWMMLGQSIGTLPGFLRLSAEISSGYVDAMSIFESGRLFWWGVAALFACGLYAWTYWRDEMERPRATAIVAMLAITWFLNWKHGFVRADGHALTLFLVCLFPAVAFPALTGEVPTSCQRRRTALMLFLSLAGIWTAYAPALSQALTTFNLRLIENVTLVEDLVHPRRLSARLRAEFAQFEKDRRLPRITALVGSAPVDVFGTEQSLAMFDNFNYTPRPVFQDYYAFTPRLARLNEAFYASPRAPRFVMQKYETIDGRVPGMDDARVLTAIFTHYTLIAVENNWLLWEKQSAVAPLSPVRAGQSTTPFGKSVTLPEISDGALWVQIDVPLSLWGRVQALLYKPPHVMIELTMSSGETPTYRLVRAMAADGFLLQPFFANQAAVINYFTGHDVAAVRSLRVMVDDDDLDCFTNELRVTCSRVPPLAREAVKPPGPPEARFRMFTLAPIRVESPHPAGPFVLDGHETFFIHAPGEMEFAPDIANTRLSGSVGMSPGAYTGPEKTDGVEIIIEHIAPSGRSTVLWHRTLNPAAVPADRGLQPFSLPLPGKGRIVLKNLTGPKNDPSYDWTLWSDLRFD